MIQTLSYIASVDFKANIKKSLPGIDTIMYPQPNQMDMNDFKIEDIVSDIKILYNDYYLLYNRATLLVFETLNYCFQYVQCRKNQGNFIRNFDR
jgi:hypothetical protein